MSTLTATLESKTITELETVELCPLCGSDKSEFLFWNVDRHYHVPGKFGLVKCGECGLARHSPRPVVQKIGEYYPSDKYYSFGNPNSLRDRGRFNTIRESIRKVVLKKLGYPVSLENGALKTLAPLLVRLFYKAGTYGYGDRFPRFTANGKALDIGCGHGAFLNLLKINGWDVAGVDLSKTAAETAKSVFDIEVFSGNVEDAPFSPASFDYIHMSHSIEHLPEPIKTLRTAFDLLRPNGKIYIETPNVLSYGLKRMKKYWMPLETPRHLFLFSASNLEKALKAAGFTGIKITTSRQNMYRWYDTYRVEEELGLMIDPRPRVRLSSRPEELIYALAARCRLWLDRQSGDFLHCQATRGEGTAE